jgi:hypothetical protein
VPLLQLQARCWLASRLEAGTSDDSFNSLGPWYLVQLSCNPRFRRRSTRAIQIIDADHVLERLLGTESPSAAIRTQ